MTTFYFETENGLISVKVKSDQPINAWEGRIEIPKGMTVKNILDAGGISTFWQTNPAFQNGEIVFSGGTPNGFSGDGTLFSFTRDGGGTLNWSNTTAYLNDGKGTPAQIQALPLKIESSVALSGFSDTTPPEPFSPVVYHDPKIFNGQPVVIFSAQDPGSGIAYYEAKEYTSQGIGGWHTAQSPYLLNPDVRKIEIKAVDNFGNERLESIRILPPFLIPAIIVLLTVFCVLILYNLRKKWKKE